VKLDGMRDRGPVMAPHCIVKKKRERKRRKKRGKGHSIRECEVLNALLAIVHL